MDLRSIKKSAAIAALVGAAASTFAETPKSDISYSDSAILGLVEGITEYLPVSSTGHLIIANAFLGLDRETPLTDKNGLPLLDSDNKQYTIKTLADAYSIVIQFGAIAAVALLYRRHIMAMFFGLLGKNPAGLKLLVNLFAAFVPAAAVGLLLHRTIETHLFGVAPVICALAGGAVVMWFAQKKYDSAKNSKKTEIEDLSVRQSLVVGVFQCAALLPGTSRSMMTILGGYVAGLDAKNSATFSFLLGLLTLTAASAFKVYKDGEAMFDALSADSLLLGLAVAFVSAAVAVKWLVGFITRRGLVPFAVYRLVVAAGLAYMLYADML